MTRVIAAALCAAGAAVSASAQLQVFTDRGAWEAAVGVGIVTQDFDSAPIGTIGDGSTLDLGNLEITRDGSANSADGDLEIADGSAFGNLNGTTFLAGETGIEPHEVVDFTFDGASVFAFGADFFSPFSGDGIALQVGNETVNIDTIAGFDQGFFGVIATGSFSTISIVGTTDAISFQELWSLDNLSYAVPTPGAAAVLGLGALAVVRRRR